MTTSETAQRTIVKVAIASDLVDFAMNGATHDRIELTLTFGDWQPFSNIRDIVLEQVRGVSAQELFGMELAVQEFGRWHAVFCQMIESSTNAHELRHRLHIDGAMPDCRHGQSAIHYFATISTHVTDEPKDSHEVVYVHQDISVDPKSLIDLVDAL
jgi:hypothetical protein